MAGSPKSRWLVVVGALLIQLCLGAVYAWSLFNQPLIERYGWDREGVVLTFSITIATFAFATIWAGRLQDRIGPRWVATAGGLLLGIGVMLTSTADSLMELYLYYGLIGGFGIGTAYVCPLITCVKWFPEKRGLISGIVVGGFGAGGVIFKPVIMRLMAAYGVNETFFYLGLIYMAAVVAGAQWLRLPPKGYGEAAVGGEKQLEPHGEKPVSLPNDVTPGEMLRSRQFYLMWVLYLFGCVAGLMVISMAVNIGTGLAGLDLASASNAVIVIALFNAAGRVSWGALSDRMGRKQTLALMYLLTAGGMFYLGMAPVGAVGFFVVISLIGFCFGGFLALFPSKTADYFGTTHLGMNYGLVYQAYGLAALVGPVMGTDLPMRTAFLIAGGLSASAVAGTYFLRQPGVVAEPVRPRYARRPQR
ncbi:MFS transporter [Heliobacterium undosum]|uniref:MFS transporter n=1 Tax=Heliomicrobium undosum TaxID=121734 RepID=A0A845L2C9_9FIRM|nr:OFA family MFS transporter [Heliomicrobium undosum]MZP29155.1 MFS transporter [Heliomicrobium undosum]